MAHKTKRLMMLLGILAATLLIADFFVPRHAYVTYDGMPAFFAICGAASCLVIVIIGGLLKCIVKRDEGYYDIIHMDASDPPAKAIGSTTNNRKQQGL